MVIQAMEVNEATPGKNVLMKKQNKARMELWDTPVSRSKAGK